MARSRLVETRISYKGVSGNAKDPSARRRVADRIKQDGDKIRNNLAKSKTTMARIALFLDSWVQRNFKTEGGNVGKWKPLKAGGRSGSGGFDSNAKILQDSGWLRASFHPFWSKGNAGIGSDVPYSKKHNDGEGDLPIRRMLPKRSEVWPKIKKMLNSFVSRAIKND